ncbi:uncharacterized protein NEMAJ01_1600 [Nematocida major]|uniref:uncharacterized protein n=1 Tax=Nematocida major TaxID=1912982 RepID=UPI0020073335|nr:uncharacterized protein NEMAJ01_1600 [Nematocida major]KAH9386704.1 hypothetical protein NEMAJ01_1600 [Nematocida major]
MSRAKPLSIEEKTKRILTLMQDKDTIFGLKDLERISLKEKGVVSQSIKEILDILVSENRAKEKKVGASKYYWSFRSDIKLQKKAEARKLRTENEKLKGAEALLLEEISTHTESRSTLADREERLKELSAKKVRQKEAEQKIKVIEENDPERLEAMKAELGALKTELSEWGDAFNVLMSYVREKYNMTQKEFCSAFSITAADMEKIEDL